MDGQKRALVIASPFGGLQGTMNDAKRMADLFAKKGFMVKEVCGPCATRDGILEAWNQLAAETCAGDVVVIYYSGHGGLAQSPDAKATERQYQFLVPIDFDRTTATDFKGILDVELSHLLYNTTKKTKNVTIILDCCHAGRMSRDPTYGNKARPKNLPKIPIPDIEAYVANLRQNILSHEEVPFESNPDAVRVVAAATAENAWEYENAHGEWTGAMTEALAGALEEDISRPTSWKSTLMRVRELVSMKFPQQHPHVEGPQSRVQFSLSEKTSEELHLIHRDGIFILDGGRIARVREGNKYSIYLFQGSLDGNDAIAEGTVIAVSGFEAEIELSFCASISIPKEGALAVLKSEPSIGKFPSKLPVGVEGLHQAVGRSRYVRSLEENEHEAWLAEFYCQSGHVMLRDRHGTQIKKQFLDGEQESESFDELVAGAECLARGHHLLALQCECLEEKLQHQVDVEVGLVENHKRVRKLETDGSGRFYEGDRAYIQLENGGSSAVYVSAFNINVKGSISVLSRSFPAGIPLGSQKTYTLGIGRFRTLDGLALSWPDGIPKTSPVTEWLIFVLSNRPVDLQHLDGSHSKAFRRSTNLSPLEVLTRAISLGANRDMRPPVDDADMYFDLIKIPFKLYPLSLRSSEFELQDTREDIHGYLEDQSCSLPVKATELADPEPVNDLDEPLWVPTLENYMSKGALGALTRTIKKIPSCIWVINEHSEEITVVVSKYRPGRLFSGFGLNASATGGGLDLSTTTYALPATKKTLSSPRQDAEGSKAVFPLWTRRDGFGVISIFKGPEKALYIENDRVPFGATAHFINKPDLKIVEYSALQNEQ